jgi:uncharacterized membrane protein YdbT with pleckstrin-like domain
MSYVDRSLIPGESVLFRTRLHWIIFTWPFVFLLLTITALYLRYTRTAQVLSAVTLMVFLARYLVYVASEFAVTNKRVIAKVGVFQRRTLELLLTKVEAIAVTQNIAGQIFGCGTIMVTGTGGTREPFSNIRSPLEFRRAVQAASSPQP